jgi:hypothetical protein
LGLIVDFFSGGREERHTVAILGDVINNDTEVAHQQDDHNKVKEATIVLTFCMH